MPRVWSVVSAWSAVANAFASAAAPAALRSVAVTLMTYELGSIDVCTLRAQRIGAEARVQPLPDPGNDRRTRDLRSGCRRELQRGLGADERSAEQREIVVRIVDNERRCRLVRLLLNERECERHSCAHDRHRRNEQSLTLDHVEISAQREFPGLFRHVSKVPRARSYRALPCRGPGRTVGYDCRVGPASAASVGGCYSGKTTSAPVNVEIYQESVKPEPE